jgi:hypothetical protein
MQSFKKSFDQLVSANPSQLILGILFVIYILANVQTPAILAGGIDNIFGKVLVIAIAVVIFMKTNPVVGVLGFVVAYQLIKTASVTTGTYAKKHYLPSEKSKMQEMHKFNQEQLQTETKQNQLLAAKSNVSGSLEVEMVDQMAPLVMNGGDSSLNYSPVLDPQHSATIINDA